MNSAVDSLPRAHLVLPTSGTIRASADDFVVDESLSFEPTAAGEHLLLRIEKRSANTEFLAEALARAYRVPRAAVSFAGRKDRHAVTRQWFSVHTASDDAPQLPVDCVLLAQTRHARKLRRGEIACNAFSIRIRHLRGDLDALASRLALLAVDPVPNYFGRQRFGHDGANVVRAARYLANHRRLRVSAFERGLHLSVARAYLFNTVLAHRVVDGSWQQCLPGDPLAFATGPLWGRGRSRAAGRVAELEADALRPLADWLAPLEHVGLVQERRALALQGRELQWQRDADTLELQFTLGPGEYATSVLREIGDFTEAATEQVAA